MLCRHVSDSGSPQSEYLPGSGRRPNGQVPSSLEKRQRSGWVTPLGPTKEIPGGGWAPNDPINSPWKGKAGTYTPVN